MGTFLLIIGFLGVVVFIVMAIISALRKTGKGKKMILFAVVSLVLMIIGVSLMPDTNETASNKTNVENKDKVQKKDEDEAKKKADEEAKKKAEQTPQQKILTSIQSLIQAKQAFDSGSYIEGDIPAGEYAFVSFKGSGKYYAEKDSANNIIDNENFDSFGYVYVHGAGNLETQGVLVNVGAFGTLGVSGAKQIYETLNNVQNYQDSGYYKVGLDLPAGQYVIQSTGQGYVAKMTGPVGKNEIIDNENFNGRYSVNVTNGQYLKISRGSITQ